ncbi:Sorting nexin-16 [Linum perenne]
MAGVLAVVLRSREAQCPLVRTIAREIVTCLVMQPVMNLASPLYINEVIEYILLAIIDNDPKDTGSDQTAGVANSGPSVSRKSSSVNPSSHITSTKNEIRKDISVDDGVDSSYSPPQADWGRVLEAATQRRTEVLTPENLENMWTKGRNYKKKENKIAKKAGSRKAKSKGSSINIPEFSSSISPAAGTVIPTKTDGKVAGCLTPHSSLDNALINEKKNEKHLIAGQSSDYFAGVYTVDAFESTIKWSMNENAGKLKRSNSTSALRDQPEKKRALEPEHGGSIISEYYSADFTGLISDPTVKVIPDKVLRSDSINVPKLRSRVMGAYFEKLGSKSFAVYSIAVTDADNRTWFVKRRYSNFEKLHRHLKDIPNYNLHLPPKRIFSSSTEDAFVHERCIQLDKYLQDLLSIANVAEQHEVWDFLSASSKIYSAGKSSSVMRTLAVNVDDAVDDIVRQFKGASGGLMRKVVGSRSLIGNTSSLNYSGDFTWNGDETSKPVSRQDTMGTENSSSDNEEGHQQENFDQEDVGPSAQASGWHSYKEVGSRTFPRRVIKRDEMSKSLNLKKNDGYLTKSDGSNRGQPLAPSSTISSTRLEDPVGMPPEWSPPNVSVPLLNLVDKVFQLKRRGWLRRQVFWISKQIVQLIMEDAIDDWLLRQIYWLRREDTIAFGIRWLQDVLWPNGTFFTRIGAAQTKPDESQHNLNSFQLDQSGVSSEASKQSSFEEQLEASRRADYIRKTLFDGVPTALVSLIGQKQYKRCARDIFYFTQSTICIKQLAYAILELVLVTVFPELRDLLRELHGKLPVPAPA